MARRTKGKENKSKLKGIGGKKEERKKEDTNPSTIGVVGKVDASHYLDMQDSRPALYSMGTSPSCDVGT
ncbi:hypothetical protein N7478_008548 [Penicillium angulare]|uniref:uncharacterized protein n=1 Tax=Penicillium angulare TaxID=116970 RepID=UPI002540B593|nr:uncharacterized protein N7478_008548 [Penicillium angulare]KAJ5273423.1 hypothetical protein N7478_008548 [Penicillium angulare]